MRSFWLAGSCLLWMAIEAGAAVPLAAPFFQPSPVADNLAGKGGALGDLGIGAATPPVILALPKSQIVSSGEPAAFQVRASGTEPLIFQWSKDRRAIPGAAEPSFEIQAVQFSDAGQYTVRVMNRFGSAEAAAALIVAPVVRVLTTTTEAKTVEVPVELAAGGNENAIGFSITYNPEVLGFTAAVPGQDAAGGVLNVNEQQASAGTVGVALALPAGRTFVNGFRRIISLRFAVLDAEVSQMVSIEVAPEPISAQVSDARANLLDAVFQGGEVIIVAGIEGDVNNDRRVTATDVTKIGRMAARLDTTGLTPGMLQRADCAPLSNGGDGALGINDWVQAARFAARLDEIRPASGPIPEVADKSASEQPKIGRSIWRHTASIPQVRATVLEAGTDGLPGVRVQLQASGQETALGFTLNFDGSRVRLLEASRGPLPPNALFLLNESQTGQGQIGVFITLPAGATFAPGEHVLLTLQFSALPRATGTAYLEFGSQLVAQEISSAEGETLEATFSRGAVVLAPESRGSAPRLELHDGIVRISPWPAALGRSDDLEPQRWEVFATDDLTKPSGAWRRLAFEIEDDGALLIRDPPSQTAPIQFYLFSTGQ